MAKYDETNGVWRTVGGRRIFIKNGQDLASAMKESGKFGKNRSSNKDNKKEYLDFDKKMRENIERVNKEYDEEITKARELGREDLEKQAKEKRIENLKKYEDMQKENMSNYKEYLKQAKEQEKDFTKEVEKENKRIHKEPNEKNIREEMKKAQEDREKKDLRRKGLSDDEIDKGYKDVNEALRDKTNSEYEEYKKMRLDDPSKYTNEDVAKFNELDKKYLDRFNKEETQVIRYRDGYAVVKNGGIQKTFDDVNDAKKFESELKSDNEYQLYKQAKENPDSIDPMTENSTDWEELDKKYKDRYNNDAEAYYSNLSQYQARQDLDMRKAWLDDDVYAPDKRKEYEEFYNNGEKYYQGKYNIDYWKKQGVDIYDKAPNGYIKLEGATTAPKGYEWYSNGKSRFGGEYKNALVKTADNQIANSLRQKAYNKYMKEHPGSKMSFEDFLKKQ